MSIKGIVFDIGQTLAYYPIPLNWSSLYRPAFESIAEKNNLSISEEEYSHIANVLAKYNARITPREIEVSSDVIFREILEGTTIPMSYIEDIRRDVVTYDDVPDTLKVLKEKGIMTATFSDVPYGMDNSFALEDIREVIDFIDIPFTSNDAGYRKPNVKGLEILLEKMNIGPSEMIFVGDEKKDIECGNRSGVVSVLINRTDEKKDFGQRFTIKSMDEILGFITGDKTV